MNTRSHRSLLILCGCLFGILAAVTGRAEDFYVAETTLGNGSGTSAANAKSVAWINSSANWASTKTGGKIGPGDIVRLVGTINSQIIVQASGAPNAPITVLFSKNAKMSNAAWSGGGAISLNAKNHIVIDGGENGLIENTANGSPASFPNSVGSAGVASTNSSNLIVRNLTIRNLYVRTDKGDTNYGGVGIRVMPTSGNTYTAIRVEKCVISDVEAGITANYRVSEVTDIVISNNTVYNVNHGIRVGDSQYGSKCRNVTISGNTVYGFSKWDEPGSNKFHHNGIFCFATNSDSRITNLKVSGNTVGSDFGAHSTSGIYLSGWIFDSLVFNNVLLGNVNTPANGLVTMRLRDGSHVGVYNNTFIGNGNYGRAIYLNGVDGGTKSADIANNIATKITFIATTYSGSWRLLSDFNLGDSLIDSRDYSHSSSSSGSFKTAPQWQGMGYDLNGRYVSANLDSNHEPVTGSPAIDGGKDLSAYFNTDKNGVIRPVGTGWDIGAYESLSGLTGISPIIDDSTQVVVDDTATAPSTGIGTSTGDVIIDFEEPAIEPTAPAVEEPVLIVDSSTGTDSAGSTPDPTPSPTPSTEDTIEVVFNPAPSTDTSTTESTTTTPDPTEPVLVADSSTSAGSSTSTESSSSTSEPVSAGNTLEPPTTSEPVIVADSSPSTDTTASPDGSAPTTEPAPSTDSSTIVVVDSSTSEPAPSTESTPIVVVDTSTSTDSTDTSTDTSKGKPGNGYGRETSGKITKAARIL